MKTTEIPTSVSRLVKKQTALIDDAIYRINNARISKFDKIQFRRALEEDPERQLEVAQEISQKILGPDFQIKAIKTSYGMLREQAELGLERYALFHQLIQPGLQQMFLTLSKKGSELVQDILDEL
jgi:hypothetical protein